MSTSHSHSHLRDPEYPSAPDSSVRSSISGYPFASSASQHALPPQAPPPQQQPQPQHPAYSSPQQPPYSPPTESDATYYRTMLREIGLGDDGGGAYPLGAVYQPAMGDGAAYAAPAAMPYHEPAHGGYTHTNPSRHHYHPYAPPPYSSSHSGYGAMVSR